MARKEIIMASRASLNKVMLIGNLTRDPEMRYTPSGAAVCTFGIATNRYYTASDGEKKEETEFIKIVSWNKLAELCSQLLAKGRKVYVEGRLQTRSWETPDGQPRQTTEVVIDDMRILDSRKSYEESGGYQAGGAPVADSVSVGQTNPTEETAKAEESSQSDTKEEKKSSSAKLKDKDSSKKEVKKTTSSDVPNKKEEGKEDIDLDDLPF